MSEENVDRFLESVELFNGGDVERLLQHYHPDVVLEVRQVELEGEYSGHDGLRRFFAEFAGGLETFEVQYSDGFAISETGCWRGGRSAAIGESERNRAARGTVAIGWRATKWSCCTHLKDYGECGRALRSRRAVGVAARSRRDFDHRQSESSRLSVNG